MVRKKKKFPLSPVSNFVVGTAVAGTVTGTFSSATGQGSGLSSGIVRGASRGVKPAASVVGTTMVLKSVSKIKVPKVKGGKKRNDNKNIY